jgi:hypothetical protein
MATIPGPLKVPDGDPLDRDVRDRRDRCEIGVGRPVNADANDAIEEARSQAEVVGRNVGRHDDRVITDQVDRPRDLEVAPVRPARDVDHAARWGAVDGGLDRLAGPHMDG